mmetsp:Transcript_1113/g.2303  ORF Transcript_1113/g.2303 Transcript_1113/m.2303 type:complete len:137 (+) Transcript_1113:233-643(+)
MVAKAKDTGGDKSRTWHRCNMELQLISVILVAPGQPRTAGLPPHSYFLCFFPFFTSPESDELSDEEEADDEDVSLCFFFFFFFLSSFFFFLSLFLPFSLLPLFSFLTFFFRCDRAAALRFFSSLSMAGSGTGGGAA